MTRRYFGTDGVRGLTNQYPMTAEFALKLALATGKLFSKQNQHPRVVIGKDTRLSGYLFESALTTGFLSMGMDVMLLGPVPTPAIGMLTKSLRASLGVMISASHNPYYDNGIKLFSPDGFKLSDELEMKIEDSIDNSDALSLAAPQMVGRTKRYEDAQARYIEIAKATFPKELSLDGLKIVVDCANGAAYRVAPSVLYELGAEVIAIGISPNGENINKDCGSLHPEGLRNKVLETKAHLGIALDGDADRILLCDEKGHILDGDTIMGIITTLWHQKGLLKGGGLVTTVMSNMGLEKYIKGLGLSFARTPVGDRYVVEQMRQEGYNIGGEQSGHIVLLDHATTGDGLLAALQVLALCVEQQKPLSELSKLFTPFPQILKNIRFSGDNPLPKPVVQDAIAAATKELGDSGRVLIRKSGTEPLIRVMVEGENSVKIEQICFELINIIERNI